MADDLAKHRTREVSFVAQSVNHSAKSMRNILVYLKLKRFWRYITPSLGPTIIVDTEEGVMNRRKRLSFKQTDKAHGYGRVVSALGSGAGFVSSMRN